MIVRVPEAAPRRPLRAPSAILRTIMYVFCSILGSLLASFGSLLAVLWLLWAPFGVLLLPFWVLLAPFWALLVQFWDHFGSNLKKECKHKVKSRFLAPESAKIARKSSCSSNFRLQTVSPRPGGRTIAAGNRDRRKIKARKSRAK